jgi:hypothetical protein
MMRELSYKLGRYKIIEGTSGGLWWESHYGLGSVQTGRCFIEGNILIIGSSEAENPGLLKREFMGHLSKLPAWEKTKYFCAIHAIHKCKTGGRVSFPAEIYEHIDGSLKTVKSIVMGEVSDSREIINDQPNAKGAFVYIKEKVDEIWDFFKRWSSKS